MSEEVTLLEFDTPIGPVWPAAMYLAVCAWPDNWPQRTRLVKALLNAGSRAAGWRHPGPDARVLERRVNRACDRLEKAFLAAEVAQRHAIRDLIYPSGRVSIKRLQSAAAHDWQTPTGPRDPEEVSNDFRTRVWRRWLPAMHYIIPLRLYIQADQVSLMSLMRETEWLNDALTSSERWAVELLPLQDRIKADTVRLVRA